MKKLEWKTEKRKVKDLVQLEFNPRKITEENKKKLIASLDKFNLAEIPCINTDNVIIGGNQRVGIMATVGRGDEVIDVRVPNRKLTQKEVKEYALISNTHAGQYDFEILEAHFEEVMFEETMFDIPGLAEWNNILDEPKKDLSDKIKTKFIVEISCENEKEQEKLYNEMIKKKYECRLLTL